MVPGYGGANEITVLKKMNKNNKNKDICILINKTRCLFTLYDRAEVRASRLTWQF